MIIHLHPDDSCGYQYEVGDRVVLNRKAGIYPKGTPGTVTHLYSGNFRLRTIRVEVKKGSWVDIVEGVWYFDPETVPFIIRKVA